MVNEQEIIIKLALAILVGGIIGIEREMRSKSAGFRTIILICMGATLFTIFSQIIGGTGNPDRIASNIVTGIGFLGAGLIYRNNNRVNGITTAASIWLSAALGMSIGAGYYKVAIIGCLLVTSVLFIFSFLDTFIDKLSQVREYKIVYPYQANHQHKYETMFQTYGLSVKSSIQSKSGNMITGFYTVKGKETRHHAFIEFILNDSEVTDFSF